MTKAVLTLNAGSSSLKVALFGTEGETPLLTGQADRIGPQGSLQLRRSDGSAIEIPSTQIRSHGDALKAILEGLSLAFPQLTLAAIGHRVVHGGDRFTEPKRITPEVMEYLATLEPFAPLHQPHNLAGIRTAMATFGEVPQVACFDTAFHRGHPFVNDSFALPYRYFEKGVRRYGFHGLSYDYVSGHLRQIAPRLAEGRVVVAHLGNGASMCGISNGRSVASTMGFSALDGLPMGTRCGQIDPGVLLFMLDQEGLTSEQIRHTLYSESGLLGLSGGLSNDMRSLEASDTPEAQRAIDYFVFRVQREVGAMAAAMGGIDALIFCGGIGEHSSLVRARVCERMGWMGIEVDHHLNQVHAQVISTELSRTTVMVIPTQEEWVIARAARVIADL
ncbi:ackA Acetate kinase [Burkholderiales bacterium]